MTLAADALSALRAATSECTATAGRTGVALANVLRGLFTGPTVIAAAAVRARLARGGRALPLPHLPNELLLQVVRHLDVRDLGRLACTCRQLYFGSPCPPLPTSVVEEELRQRAAEAWRWLPSSPPAGVSGWVSALLQREWRDSLEVSTVAAGESPHSLFVDANGARLACGFESELGTLGLPEDQEDEEDELLSLRTVLVPTPVPSLAGIRIRQVAAGFDCNLALSEAGRVYMWGGAWLELLELTEESQLVPTLIQELCHHRVRQVAISYDLCAAVTEEGLLFTWVTPIGEALYENEPEETRPRLGLGLDGATAGNALLPRCVTALKHERVGSVAVGNGFTLVTTEAGALFSFGGGGMDASLGHGNTGTCMLPKRVEALDAFYVATVAVASGGYYSLALTACGRVFWWGKFIKSTTELETQVLPQRVVSAFGGGRVRGIAASYTTAYAVTDAGVLFSWGCDSRFHGGTFPLEPGKGQVHRSPRPVAGLHGITVVGVSAGERHTLALAADGSVYGFGRGKALGIGWGLGGEEYPEWFEGDPVDEGEGQMILDTLGERNQLTPKKISGLVFFVPRAHRGE
jgi:hypothetical protein